MSIESPGQEIGIDKKLWDAMIDIMKGFEILNREENFSTQIRLLDRVYDEVIDACPTFSGEKKKKYKYAIDSIKTLLDEIVSPYVSVEKKKSLCVQKANFVGILPGDYEIRQNVIKITTIPELEDTDLLK